MPSLQAAEFAQLYVCSKLCSTHFAQLKREITLAHIWPVHAKTLRLLKDYWLRGPKTINTVPVVADMVIAPIVTAVRFRSFSKPLHKDDYTEEIPKWWSQLCCHVPAFVCLKTIIQKNCSYLWQLIHN